MALNFPANPKRGDIITAGERKWKYTGTTWIRVDRANQGARGIPGATGSAGATGATGATGPVEEFVASINGLTGDIITDGLTFAFAGISVGASGITVGGDIRFSEATGEIKNNTSADATIDINVGTNDFTIARFDRSDIVVTIGDVDHTTSGGKDTRIVVNDKSETVDVYADSKLHLHNGVLFPESGISLGVGLTFPDGTFQSSAHAPHEFVASFNGATGAIEGVNSFNGLTGAVTTTDLTLQVVGISASGGITFADGSHQNTAAERGYQYTVTDSTPSSGEVYIKSLFGVVETISLHATDGDGNDLEVLLEDFTDHGGSIKFSTLDGKTISQVRSNYTLSSNRTFNDSTKVFTFTQGAGTGFIFEEPNAGDVVYMTMTPNEPSLVTSIGGFTGAFQVSDGMVVDELVPGIPVLKQSPSYTKNTATFTISASSAIATGQKTDSLHRFPYDATLTNIDVKVNGSGGFTAGAIIAGPDFGNPATSSLTGGTLGIEGITGSSTVFNNTSVTAGGFMFFDVISNDSGSTQAQMFVSYQRR